MNKKLYLLTLLPLVFSCVGCKKEGTPINVIILSGQSNAVGCKAGLNLKTSMGVDKYNEYLDGYSDIKIAYECWTKHYESTPETFELQNSSPVGKFVDVKLGYGNTTANFGPEVGMAEYLRTNWSNKVVILKCACGASNLRDNWAKWQTIMHKELVQFVDDNMTYLKKSGYKPTIRAFCWMQGEGDSYAGFYSVYKEKLWQFKNNLLDAEELLNYTDGGILPFIDAGIGSGEGEWTYYQQVNQQKQLFAAESEYNIYFDTIAAGLHTNQEPNDYVHYDSESQIQLGHLFAQHVEPYLK